jgi:hypothetical protein
MPAQKDLKRLIRARMLKTGEAYTAARRQLLSRKASASPIPASPAPSAPTSADYARLAGMSDSAVKAKTGCNWERWVYALDRAGAPAWSHREIAEHVRKSYKLTGWWSQSVTVGYERIKGLRAIGQRRDGGFEANKSKTFQLPVSRLYRAFRDARLRGRWLPDVAPTVRTATKDKSLRLTWPDGTRVEAYFWPKGRAKAQVQLQHRGLPDKASATRTKAFWEERLKELERWSMAG